MQSAAQPEYAPAFTGPDQGLGYPPDYTGLPFDSHTKVHTPLSLNPPYTTGSETWHNSLLGDIDPGYAAAGYAAFAAPACDGTSLPAGLATAPLISSSYDIDVTTSLNVNDTYVIKHTCGL